MQDREGRDGAGEDDVQPGQASFFGGSQFGGLDDHDVVVFEALGE
jgi:hypothetical protein